MRISVFALALAALFAAAGHITSASAGGEWRGGYERPIVDDRFERPRYRRDRIYVDPYSYYYRPRNYYPYYDSGYWRPAYEMRERRRWHRVPPYYSSWGYSRGDRGYRRDRGWGWDRRRWR